MTLASPAVDLGSPGPHDHIVDVLIAERAPKLTGSALWPLVRPALYALLDYRKARRMADAMAPLPGPAAVEHVARLLDLKVFPADVASREIALYKRKQQPFGLPLDNRADYTKADWIVWTATLTDARADFEALVNPVYRFLHQTPDRVPFTDWYYTSTGQHRGFQARSVVGGVFIPLLRDRALISAWSKRAS